MNNKTEKSRSSSKANDNTSAKEIIEWLGDHPSFFDEHRTIISKLDLPSDAGTAISLHQYQVRLMREEKREMDSKLALLVKNARTNHKINQDLLGLAAKLIKHAKVGKTKPSQTQLIADHFALHSANLIEVKASPIVTTLLDALKDSEPICENKVDKAVLKYLFEKQQEEIKSYAVVPLSQKGKLHSLLALGADDKERFKPKMGNEFLKQLGYLIQELV